MGELEKLPDPKSVLGAMEVMDPDSVTPEDEDKYRPVRDILENVLTLVSEELKERFEDPIKVRKILRSMSIAELLNYAMKLMAVVKKNAPVVLSKKYEVNFHQVNQLTQEIANDAASRKHIRAEAKRQIKNLPT